MATAAIPFTIDLTLSERFMLVQVIPQEGNILVLQRGQELKSRLIPSESEQKKWGVKSVPLGGGGESITWDEDIAANTEPVHIGETMFDFFAKYFKERNDENKLTLADISLYKKFVEAPAIAATNGKSHLELSQEVEA